MAAVEDMTFSDAQTILVVEDENLIRMLLADYLQDCGFKTLEAGNAAEAVEILLTNEAAIDLVISDITMPGAMDGFGLSQWMRARCPTTPILLTSGDMKKARFAREIYDREAFLPKPYDLNVVVSQVREMITAHKKRIV